MIGTLKKVRHAYGFEDVAIVPGDVTVNPEQANLDLEIGQLRFSLPIIASAMDAVVSPDVAVRLSDMGGLGILNMEGLYSRYEDAAGKIDEITSAPAERVTEVLQKLYQEPMKEDLVAKRVEQIKGAGATCAFSFTPQNTKRMGPVAVEAGADILVVQSTVTTARHVSKSYHGLVFSELVEQINVPVVVGNCVTYSASIELMGNWCSGHPSWRRTRRGMYHARGDRRRCSSSYRHHGLRRCQRRILPPHRAIRISNHRRWHSHRRGFMQIDSSRRRRSDDRHALCSDERSSRQGVQLGYGHASPGLAQRYQNKDRHQGNLGPVALWALKPYGRDAKLSRCAAGLHGNVRRA